MRLISMCAVLGLAGTFALAQAPADQSRQPGKDCSPAGSAATPAAGVKPCAPAAATAPSAAQQFPYPGESHAADPTPPPSPSAPAPEAAKQFPYPGDTSSSNSNSSSSSSSGSGSSGSGDGSDAESGGSSSSAGDVGHEPSVRRKLPKPARMQSDEDRETEDLSVAKFYRQSGNLQAAYLRTKDAVKMQPDDPEAHFAHAEMARLLRKKDEAIAEYSVYLRLEPDGDQAKASVKALAALR